MEPGETLTADGDGGDVAACMPMNVGDYLAETADLTADEHGAYVLLLLHLWKRGGYLPDDPLRLARLARIEPERWSQLWGALSRFFVTASGQISQPRLLRDLHRATTIQRTASERGRRGAAGRWPKRCSGNAQASPQLMLKHSSSNAQALPEQCASTSLYEGSGSEKDPDPDPDRRKEEEEKNGSGENKRAKARLPRAQARALVVGGPLYDSVLATFCRLWERRYHEAYVPTGGDKSQLGRLLQGLPPERVEDLGRCFAAYLRDRDAFVEQKQRHSLAWFCTSGGLNKYRVEVALLSEREAKGAAAAEQWLGMGRGRDGD